MSDTALNAIQVALPLLFALGIILLAFSGRRQPELNADGKARRPAVGTAAVMVRADDRRVLLGLRQGSHGAGFWALPGGHLEWAESFEESVAREVEEETGITISDVRRLTFTNDILADDDKHYVTLYFGCTIEPGIEPQLLEPHKCVRWQWFAIDELPEDELWPGLGTTLREVVPHVDWRAPEKAVENLATRMSVEELIAKTAPRGQAPTDQQPYIASRWDGDQPRYSGLDLDRIDFHKNPTYGYAPATVTDEVGPHIEAEDSA